MTSSIAIFYIHSQLVVWYLAPPSAPRRVKVQGQQSLHLSSPEALVEAYSDMTDRLRGENLNVSEVHWLIDQAGHTLWAASLPKLDKAPHPPVWQSLSWEWLAARFGLTADQPLDTLLDVLEAELLPWLVAADDAAERHQMKAALEREHLNDAERLAAERVRLEQDNERLRAQNAALQQVDAERLVSFLPALFPRVFTVIGAADLALLCGHVKPLPIPNPYPEPSEETVHILQKDFRALPRELQRQIVRFVTRLPQRQKLQARAEMRDLLRELEAG